MTDLEVMRQQLSDAFEELGRSGAVSGAEKCNERAAPPNLAVRGLLGLVTLYRLLLSPLLGGRCRFYPTCSRYAMEAITEWGAVRGVVMAGKRLVKCHPFHPGGYDPVPPAYERGG